MFTCAVILQLLITAAGAISFDVSATTPTCLQYTIERVTEIPRIEIKYISSRAEEGSMLEVTTLDPHRREVEVELFSPSSLKGAKWRVVGVLTPDARPAVEKKGFSTAGDYAVCFKRRQSSSSPRAASDESTFVEILLGDPRVHHVLQKHTVATRGEGALYFGSVRSIQSDEAELSADDAEEYSTWINELESELDVINQNFEYFKERHAEFSATSNRVCTRIWLMAVLTLLAMCGSITYSHTALKKTIAAKKLV